MLLGFSVIGFIRELQCVRTRLNGLNLRKFSNLHSIFQTHELLSRHAKRQRQHQYDKATDRVHFCQWLCFFSEFMVYLPLSLNLSTTGRKGFEYSGLRSVSMIFSKAESWSGVSP